MTIDEAIMVLELHNAWRKGAEERIFFHWEKEVEGKEVNK